MKLRQRKKNIRKFLAEKKKHYLGKGVQYIYHLPNRNVISVIKFEGGNGRLRWGSYGAESGLYELADMHLGEVFGHLTQKHVLEHLEWALKQEAKYEKNHRIYF